MILKSDGCNESEKELIQFCEKTFFPLWCYPNPYKDDGKELCDLLVVFDKHVFVFFNRKSDLLNKEEKDPETIWARWKRDVIEAQVRTVRGAERYLRSGRKIYLDSQQKMPFPLSFNIETSILHRIIIAHGAQDACKKASSDNVYGSLAIKYSDGQGDDSGFRFLLSFGKDRPVHVFDSVNLHIIFGELDTATDFSRYLTVKEDAINSFQTLIYCGEEDLLAHYLCNIDKKTNTHRIGFADGSQHVYIEEGNWADLIKSDSYKRKRKIDNDFCLLDNRLKVWSEKVLNKGISQNSDVSAEAQLLFEIAKIPRIERRVFSDKMQLAITGFSETRYEVSSNLTYLESVCYPDTGYIFLQVDINTVGVSLTEIRQKRTTLLECACGAAKNKFPQLMKVIGIVIFAPKFNKHAWEELIIFDYSTWSEEQRRDTEENAKRLGLFISEPNTYSAKYFPS